MIAGLVSTVIPVYNRTAQLREAVASVLSQNYRPIEIIIVDDGSTDPATLTVANELATQSPSIVRVATQANRGPGSAREHGRQLALGEFIQFLDSDDLLLPGKFSAQVQGLREKPAAGISYGLTLELNQLNGNAQVTHGTEVRHQNLIPAIFKDRIWHTITPLYRSSVCEAIGPWKAARILEDWDYDCRAALLNIPLHYVVEPVAVHRHHGGVHAGRAWVNDPSALHDRLTAYQDVVGYAVRAGISRDSAEFKHLIRSVFWIGREAAALGMQDAARSLLNLAREHSRGRNFQILLFELAAALVGWQRAGRLSRTLKRWRLV